jgi:thioredoxin 1
MNSSFEAPENELMVTDQSFNSEVLAEAQPVLVDLWAPWCGPCRMIAPVVNELAAEYIGRAKVVKLNVDDNPETTARFGVASIPTLLIFKKGQLVDRMTGYTSKKTLAGKLDAQLN